MLESKVEERLRTKVKDILKGEAYKFTSPNRRSVPDRLVLLPGGRVVFVECKSTTGKLTPGQSREILRLRYMGFPVFVVRSYEEVDDLIQELNL